MTNSMSLRGGQELSDVVISNNNNGIATHSLAMTKNNGTPTGFAADAPDVVNILNNPEFHYTVWDEAYNEIDPNPVNYPVEWKEIDATEAQNYTWQDESTPASTTIHHEDELGNLVSSEGAIRIQISDSETKYYSYVYTRPDNYERLSNVTVKPSSGNIENAYFYGDNGTSVNVKNLNVIKNVDFIRNNIGINLASNSIKGIKGNFIDNNDPISAYPYAYINGNGNIQGSFINNNRSVWAAANSQVNFIYSIFVGNHQNVSSDTADGGSLVLGNMLTREIISVFIDNYAKSELEIAKGGAIHSFNTTRIGNLESIFISNYTDGNTESLGGALYNEGTIGTTDSQDKAFGITNSEFYWNRAISENGVAKGGAIYNSGTIGRAAINGGIENSNFIGNYAKSTSGTAQGGAIWTSKDLNVIADNGTSTFKGNYVQEGNGEKDYQAIWVSGADKKLNLQQYNNGKMYMYDNINGTNGYTVNIEGDGTGTYYMYNDIKNANVTFNNTTVNTVNNDIHTYDFNSFELKGDTNFVPDVDLVSEQMDRITSSAYTVSDGATLHVTSMNLLNDATKDNTKILFAEEGLANNVDTTVKTVSYSPIYKYDVNYVVDENDNQGYFTFARSASGGSEDFNPAVIEAPVAVQAGAMATMQNTFNYSFASSDSIMDMPSAERTALINRNKYAIENSSLDEGTNPLYQPVDTSTVWFKPYASFENVPLDNGPAVRTISYGTLVGYDTDLKELKKGWARNWTGYVGYNGASMSYSNVDTYQNGGLIGGTLSLYKGKFFNATTISTGATVGESHTMYGHENNTSLLAGVGNKTGYNFEFKDGRYIIQPNIFIGYTFVKTFDFKNAAGVDIESKPFNNLQLSPGVKFIMNTKKGWQPYVGVNMVWNVLNKSDVTANGVHLPNMSIRPYIQYGIGIQKKVKDNFTAYGQAMVQNGGRNGVSLTFGFRWAIGLDKKSVEKVHKPNKPDITPKITNAQFVK